MVGGSLDASCVLSLLLLLWMSLPVAAADSSPPIRISAAVLTAFSTILRCFAVFIAAPCSSSVGHRLVLEVVLHPACGGGALRACGEALSGSAFGARSRSMPEVVLPPACGSSTPDMLLPLPCGPRRTPTAAATPSPPPLLYPLDAADYPCQEACTPLSLSCQQLPPLCGLSAARGVPIATLLPVLTDDDAFLICWCEKASSDNKPRHDTQKRVIIQDHKN